jgi:hypothetical protein
VLDADLIDRRFREMPYIFRGQAAPVVARVSRAPFFAADTAASTDQSARRNRDGAPCGLLRCARNLGSTGSLPVVVGSLPTTSRTLQKEVGSNVRRAFRQAAEKDRLAAWLPRHEPAMRRHWLKSQSKALRRRGVRFRAPRHLPLETTRRKKKS